MSINRKHIGGTLDDFLKEEGIYDEVRRESAKMLLAFKLQKEMRKQKVTKTALAQRMGTSRSSVHRVLDPRNRTVSLDTLERAAAAVGKHLRVDLV